MSSAAGLCNKWTGRVSEREEEEEAAGLCRFFLRTYANL